MDKLEIGQTFISEDGDYVWISVSEEVLVSWSSTVGWVQEGNRTGISLIHDMPTGSIDRTWCTTSGVWDDLRERFLKPSTFRDTSKRIYKNRRNGGTSIDGSVEDPMEAWMMHRMHKMAIRLNGVDG